MKVLAVSLFLLAGLLPCLGQNVFLHGDLRQWHKVNLSVEGPSVNETNSSPNPFTDYRFNVTFRHESGSPEYVVPGYFAADGNAAHTSAGSGKIWRAHLCPDKPGEWRYTIEFRKGKDAAIDEDAKTEVIQPLHRRTGYFKIEATNKKAPDFRARGRLEYVDKRYLKFAGSGGVFPEIRNGLAREPSGLHRFRRDAGEHEQSIAPGRGRPRRFAQVPAAREGLERGRSLLEGRKR
jgi:hypothetical protein